jgi:hypothetical protein
MPEMKSPIKGLGYDVVVASLHTLSLVENK